MWIVVTLQFQKSEFTGGGEFKEQIDARLQHLGKLDVEPAATLGTGNELKERVRRVGYQ